MINDALKAIGQIGDPPFLRVLAMGVGLTIALLFAFTVAFAWSIGLIVPDSFTIPWIGDITWIDNALSFAVIPLMMVLSVFLMVPVASAFTGLFLDQVVDAVEAKHYPAAPAVSPLPLSETIVESLRFLGVLIVANLVALILYITPLAPFVFWGLNGFLLGREYATLVAQRRLGGSGARNFRASNRLQIWGLGILMAVPLTIPVINLLVPILGVAAFTHLFHRLNRP